MSGRFDHTNFGQRYAKGRERSRGFVSATLTRAEGPLAPFLEDPQEAKRAGLLPLTPPSRPRLDDGEGT